MGINSVGFLFSGERVADDSTPVHSHSGIGACPGVAESSSGCGSSSLAEVLNRLPSLDASAACASQRATEFLGFRPTRDNAQGSKEFPAFCNSPIHKTLGTSSFLNAMMHTNLGFPHACIQPSCIKKNFRKFPHLQFHRPQVLEASGILSSIMQGVGG